MESFQLKMPSCSECGSTDTKIDISDYSNLVRIPAATATAAMVGIPFNSISFKCTKCGASFKDKGIE